MPLGSWPTPYVLVVVLNDPAWTVCVHEKACGVVLCVKKIDDGNTHRE